MKAQIRLAATAVFLPLMIAACGEKTKTEEAAEKLESVAETLQDATTDALEAGNEAINEVEEEIEEEIEEITTPEPENP